jgi:uncharacterized membrane protein
VSARAAHLAACILLVALIFLGLAWELWLAPLRPGGSWLVLKVLPLLAPVFGMFRGERYTFQWASLLLWAYFAEGVVRAMVDPWPSSLLAGVEIALSLALFAAIVAYLRAARSA